MSESLAIGVVVVVAPLILLLDPAPTCESIAMGVDDMAMVGIPIAIVQG